MSAKPQPGKEPEREIEAKATNGRVRFLYEATFKRLARDVVIVASSISGAYYTAQKVIAAHDAQFEARIVACEKARSDDRSTILDQGRRIRELEDLLPTKYPIFERYIPGKPTTAGGSAHSAPGSRLQRPVSSTYGQPE